MLEKLLQNYHIDRFLDVFKETNFFFLISDSTLFWPPIFLDGPAKRTTNFSNSSNVYQTKTGNKSLAKWRPRKTGKIIFIRSPINYNLLYVLMKPFLWS